MKIIPRNNLLIVLAKNDNEIMKIMRWNPSKSIALSTNIDTTDNIEVVRCESELRVIKIFNETKVPTSVVILNYNSQIPLKVKVGHL